MAAARPGAPASGSAGGPTTTGRVGQTDPMRRTAQLLSVPIVLVLLLAGCSDDEGDDDAATVDETTESTAPGVEGGSTSTTAAEPTATIAPFDESYVSDTYADAAHWLCRPGMAENPCETGLDVTVINDDGTTELRPHEVAEDPAFDCFYLYPTINLGDEGNAPFDGDYGPEAGVARTQAGHFSSMCRVFAPVYRQVTLAAFPRAEEEGLYDIAYGDALDAFKHYLANDNDGRGVILMGHSQGSGLLRQLMQETVDVDPTVRDRLIAAYLLGTSVEVPIGAEVGGSFQEIPPCRAADQVGCVVSYASFDAEKPPGEDTFFGTAADDEHVAICTNPAALGGGFAELQMITAVAADADAEFGVAADTPYVALPGLVSGQCVEQNGVNYLEIAVNAGPGPRIDEVKGDLGPQWGLHAIDYNLALGDLLALAGGQAEAWQAAQ